MIDVYFIVLENSLALDLSGPSESLRIANRVLESHGKPEFFKLHYVGFEESVTLSTQMQMSNIKPLPTLSELKSYVENTGTNKKTAWLVLLGQEGMTSLNPNLLQNKKLITWLKAVPIKKDAVEILCVCAGSLFLAYAGRLEQKRVTTHHRDIEQLQKISPEAQVQQDCIFVDDEAVSSSAGVTTGIDLMVYKIANVCGEVVASEVAQWLVMPHRRTQNDKQHSVLLEYRRHIHPQVQKVQEVISMFPKEDWTLHTLAELAHTSPRNLTRLFNKHAGISPVQYLSQVRLELAKAALTSGQSISFAAAYAGFRSDLQLRRALNKIDG